MKCPNCKNEMEKGILASDGRGWFSENSKIAKIKKNWFFGGGEPVGEKVTAFRCSSCGKIELQI